MPSMLFMPWICFVTLQLMPPFVVIEKATDDAESIGKTHGGQAIILLLLIPTEDRHKTDEVVWKEWKCGKIELKPIEDDCS